MVMATQGNWITSTVAGGFSARRSFNPIYDVRLIYSSRGDSCLRGFSKAGFIGYRV
ncbi:hypothetical protein J1N35_032585 [Gossypium stocksii]|uniref:Uncharacterized protein n=1 Tax=Gossypium stocksii TaxID=47602 RepID=A0A9D3ZVU6_9ROSI|nr:hypothetical protein J1N35_032585 [Gossypium stocksii]